MFFVFAVAGLGIVGTIGCQRTNKQEAVKTEIDTPIVQAKKRHPPPKLFQGTIPESGPAELTMRVNMD